MLDSTRQSLPIIGSCQPLLVLILLNASSADLTINHNEHIAHIVTSSTRIVILKSAHTATSIDSIRFIAHIATFSRSPDRSLPAAAGLVQLHCWGPSRTCQAGCLPANTEKQHNKYLKFSRKYREIAQQINPDILYESYQ